MDWKLAEAKNRLSHVMDLALTKGPQRITRRGVSVIVVAETEYEPSNSQPKKNFLQHLMSGPSLEGVDLTRNKSVTRGADFGIK